MELQSSFYKYLSLIKLIIGILILIIDYTAINVFEDTLAAVGIGLVGCFLFCRGGSFFFFYLTYNISKSLNSRKGIDQEKIGSESYKLSFLFGMYALLNIILIFLGFWNKILGLILLCGFILILYAISLDNLKHAKKVE